MTYINFQKLKARVSIIDAAWALSLNVEPNDKLGFRSKCPACESSDDRALVVTPEKGVFYCHEAKTGGDCIALVAHIKGVNMKEAAIFLDDACKAEQQPDELPESDKPIQSDDWQGLSYLEAEHELVKEMGFDVDICEQAGIGYAKKGMMRGKVAIPIRLSNGVLIGYIGVTEAKLPGNWRSTS